MVENLASIYQMKTTQKRIPWTFQSQKGGYWKQFKSPVGTLDFVTVKVSNPLALEKQSTTSAVKMDT